MTQGGVVGGVGAVEVLQDVNSRMWYCGFIVDIVRKGEVIKVRFDEDVWQVREFPAAQVRKPEKRAGGTAEGFNPRVGDEVDLQVKPTDAAPGGWGAAVVRNIKHGFYFVGRLGTTSHEAHGEAIVEKSMLRPLAPSTGLEADQLSQEIFKLSQPLQGWANTSDAAGCLGHIEDQAGLVTVCVQRTDLKLIGNEKAIARAKMLLEVHTKHQSQIISFQDMREKRLLALENKRNRIEGTGFKHSIEVRIEPNFVSRVIGKGGEAIRNVEEKYEVNVRVMDKEGSDDYRKVKIFGNSVEALEKARGEVEYTEEAIPVEPHMNSWMLGRGGKTIQHFRQLAGLVYAKLDRDANQLLVCGTRNAVEEGIAMFETHLMYYPVFHQMDEEMEQIITKLEEYGDSNARWEWGWWKDEEPQDDASNRFRDSYGYGGYGGGGGAGGFKGKSKGKGGKGVGKGGGKGGNKGGGKSRQSWDWEDDQQQSQQLATRPAKGRSGKGGGGGAGGGGEKGGGGKQSWQEVRRDGGGQRQATWREREEEAEEEEPAPRPTKGRGARGPRSSPVTARSGPAGAAVAAAAAAPKAATAPAGGGGAAAGGGGVEAPARPAARKMGKHGMRS